MPIYVYEPTIYSNNEQVNECCYFEVLQSIGEKPLNQCPTCLHAIHKAVSTFNVGDVSFFKKENSSSVEEGNSGSFGAKNAARLATRHLCGSGCSH